MRLFGRKNASGFAVDVDAALRQLAQLHGTGKLSIGAPVVAHAAQLAVPPPREERSVSWQIAVGDQVLVRGHAPEVDPGTARRLAAALAHRLGQPLQLCYTATSTFTPTKEA